MGSINRRGFVSHLPFVSCAGMAMAGVSASPAGQVSAVPLSSPMPLFNIRDYGAAGDGTTLDTAAIEAAIAACTGHGGGMVYFPPGRYLSGTITLRDNVTLHLSAGATLVGSPAAKDYPPQPFPARDLDIGGFEVWALIYARGARNIAIEGRGTIDGNGKFFPPLPKIQPLDVASGPRPRAIFLKDCQRVVLRDVLISNSAMWSLHLARCENVLVEGITVFSEFFVQQDGIVLDSSRNVRVIGCTVNTVDDAMVFKSSFPQPCEHVVVSDCVLTCHSSAIKFGTQSLGGFRNLAIANCVCHDCRLGGIKFEAIDGGTLEDVTVSNISMVNVSAPLFFRLGNRGRDFGFREVAQPQPIGRLRNIIVTGLRAAMTSVETLYQGGATAGTPRRAMPMRTANTNILAGLPGHPVENIVLSDIHITSPGGGTAEEARRRDIPEEPSRYPENDMFGILPAWGFFVRHAQGITLRNVELELARDDLRTAFIADDVAGLELNGFRAAGRGAGGFIRLRDARAARIQDCRPLGPVSTFVELEGPDSGDIALVGNDPRLADRALQKADDFTGPVVSAGNLGGL